MQVSDLLLELVATVIGPSQLLRPDISLALVGAKLVTCNSVRVIVLSDQRMRELKLGGAWREADLLVSSIEDASLATCVASTNHRQLKSLRKSGGLSFKFSDTGLCLLVDEFQVLCLTLDISKMKRILALLLLGLLFDLDNLLVQFVVLAYQSCILLLQGLDLLLNTYMVR